MKQIRSRRRSTQNPYTAPRWQKTWKHEWPGSYCSWFHSVIDCFAVNSLRTSLAHCYSASLSSCAVRGNHAVIRTFFAGLMEWSSLNFPLFISSETAVFRVFFCHNIWRCAKKTFKESATGQWLPQTVATHPLKNCHWD